MRDIEAFTDLELAFFRAGDLLEQASSIEAWEDMTALPLPAVLHDDSNDEDDWEWEIAIARARHAA
jgi:hypothetical protein